MVYIKCQPFSFSSTSLVQVVIREAISFGATDCSVKASLVNWILPYAQRYIFNVHSDKYLQLKQTVNEKLITLQVVIVEKLFYRNVIKRCPGADSKKRFECSCLLQVWDTYKDHNEFL